ncbi:MAG: hypothetical protein Q9222_006368 [Ikaeria aurantiellina]
MRLHVLAASVLSFLGFTSAIPASDRIPTAISQIKPATGLNSSSNPLTSFDQRIEVPGTDTVLYANQGTQVPRIPLRILIYRVQFELNDLIAKYGRDRIPAVSGIPKYSFQTTTPQGVDCYFFTNVIVGETISYGLINETLAGLKRYLIDEGRSEQLVFEIYSGRVGKGFGGLAVGDPTADVMQASSNDTSISSDPARVAAFASVTATDVELSCTFAGPLSSGDILQVLSLARNAAAAGVRQSGAGAELPGETGEWEVEGHLGAMFKILGVAPRHITWGIMAGAVSQLRRILIYDRVNRETECTIHVEGIEGSAGIIGVKAAGVSAQR